MHNKSIGYLLILGFFGTLLVLICGMEEEKQSEIPLNNVNIQLIEEDQNLEVPFSDDDDEDDDDFDDETADLNGGDDQ